jgi:hypothetical protein
MTAPNLQDWVPVQSIPTRTNGLISLNRAKRDFRERATNGLAEDGIAVLIGRKALVHFPRYLSRVFGSDSKAA